LGTGGGGENIHSNGTVKDREGVGNSRSVSTADGRKGLQKCYENIRRKTKKECGKVGAAARGKHRRETNDPGGILTFKNPKSNGQPPRASPYGSRGSRKKGEGPLKFSDVLNPETGVGDKHNPEKLKLDKAEGKYREVVTV